MHHHQQAAAVVVEVGSIHFGSNLAVVAFEVANSEEAFVPEEMANLVVASAAADWDRMTDSIVPVDKEVEYQAVVAVVPP